MAWGRVDGKAKRNPSLSYSNSYAAWHIARLDGHVAYTIGNSDELPTADTPWDCYTTCSGVEMAKGPAPKITIHDSDPRQITASDPFEDGQKVKDIDENIKQLDAVLEEFEGEDRVALESRIATLEQSRDEE